MSLSRLHQTPLTSGKAQKIMTANTFVTQHADANEFCSPDHFQRHLQFYMSADEESSVLCCQTLNT
jgi:hypothetical protein